MDTTANTHHNFGFEFIVAMMLSSKVGQKLLDVLTCEQGEQVESLMCKAEFSGAPMKNRDACAVQWIAQAKAHKVQQEADTVRLAARRALRTQRRAMQRVSLVMR